MWPARGGRLTTIVLAAAGVLSVSVGAHQPSTAAPDLRAGNLQAAAALRSRGLQLGYNLDHAEALEAFKGAAAEDPSDPTAYRLAAGTAWIALLFQQGAITVDDYLGQARANLPRQAPTSALAGAFHQNLARAVALSEQQLREHPADPEAHFQVGSAYGFLASYTATVEGRVLGSLGSARRAYREHARVLALDPQRKDAGLIVGMYRYAVANLSAPMRLLARLAGFGGDREAGIRLVEDAARYPSAVQANALFALILMYNREARYEAALDVIARLRELYPGNRLLWLEAGSTALRAGRAADAKVFLEEGLARMSKDTRARASGEDSRWQYAYGSALVALREVAGAERALAAALVGAERAWVRGRIHEELGKLADLRSDRPHALTEYRAAERLCQEDHDSDCSKELKALMKTRYR